METSLFWIVTGTTASIYIAGLMLMKSMPATGTILRRVGLVLAIGLIIWAAVIDLV